MKERSNIKDEKKGCPWGKKCKECNLYQPIYEKNLKGVVIAKVWDCQINHLSTLTEESKDRTLGVQAAIESLRNEILEAVEDMMLESTQTRKEKRIVPQQPRFIQNG